MIDRPSAYDVISSNSTIIVRDRLMNRSVLLLQSDAHNINVFGRGRSVSCLQRILVADELVLRFDNRFFKIAFCEKRIFLNWFFSTVF